jgi:hypothetical protein
MHKGCGSVQQPFLIKTISACAFLARLVGGLTEAERFRAEACINFALALFDMLVEIRDLVGSAPLIQLQYAHSDADVEYF